MPTKDPFIAIGKIGAPWGLKGAFKVHLYNPDSQILFELEKVWVDSGKAPSALGILAARVQGKSIILHLEGVSSPEKALLWRGEEIFIPSKALAPPEQGEFYHFQLIGLDVFATSGEKIGILKQIANYGASDVFEIEQEGTKEALLVPYTRDFVKEVSLSKKQIIIAPMEYTSDDPS